MLGTPHTCLILPRYLLVTAGAGGLALAGCYWVVDVRGWCDRIWQPFMYFGMNAITMFLFMEGDIIDCPLSFFYLKDPDNSLQNILWPTGVFWGDSPTVLPTVPSHNPYVFGWCVAYIGFWMVVAWGMYVKGIFIKL